MLSVYYLFQTLPKGKEDRDDISIDHFFIKAVFKFRFPKTFSEHSLEIKQYKINISDQNEADRSIFYHPIL